MNVLDHVMPRVYLVVVERCLKIGKFVVGIGSRCLLVSIVTKFQRHGSGEIEGKRHLAHDIQSVGHIGVSAGIFVEYS